MLGQFIAAFDFVRTSGVTVTDICLVLVGLLLLVLLVSFFRGRSNAVPSSPPVSQPTQNSYVASDEIDEETLAAIFAAVYTYLGDNGQGSYKITSVRRAGCAARSAWAQAGINQNTSRF